MILNTKSITTSQNYFENLLSHMIFDWNFMYLLPTLVAQDSCLRALRYKILNNVLYLNKKLFQFRKVETSLCSVCKNVEEIPTHLFIN